MKRYQINYFRVNVTAKLLDGYSKIELEEELLKMRHQGYVLSYGETTSGTLGIGVPIFGGEGVEASLSIAAPKPRLQTEYF